MLKTRVKASGITNLTDARYFAAWQVDYMGFDLTTVAHGTSSLAEIKEMKDWVEGPKFVGEIDRLDISKTRAIINFLSLEVIQVGMFTPLEYCNSLGDLSIIKAVIIEPDTPFSQIEGHLEKYFNYVDFFLLDFSKNGINWKQLQKNQPFSIANLHKICRKYQTFLSLNFDPSEMEKLLEKINPFGLSLEGGNEEKTGFKSFERLDEVFEMLNKN